MYDKQCAICGAPFQSVKSNAKYCSNPCKRKAEAIAYEKNKHDKVCVVCGKTFRAKHIETRCCSGRCAKHAQAMGEYDRPAPGTMEKYHSRTLDQKARLWGKDYGKYQANLTLLEVGGVDVEGIMNELKR